MPLEEFIITVLCWVDEGVEAPTRGIELRTRGFAPRLSDSEAITMEIVGEMLGHDGDEAIWEYCRRHWAAWFPGLGDRTTLVRQAANLWRIKQLLHEPLVEALGARAAAGHIIDGFPHRRVQAGPCGAQPGPQSGSRLRLLCGQGRV